MYELASLEVKDCQRCDLWKTRTQIVNGSGNLRAAVMFTGEAPGKMEDLRGIGFQGQAGKLFDAILSHLGLTRQTIWLNNAVRCRPLAGRKNRPPRTEEVTACRPWLIQDTENIGPRVMVTMGRIAYESVSGRDDFQAKRGTIVQSSVGPTLFPLFHPAYLIYRRSARLVMCHDLQKLGHYLDEMGIEREKHADRENIFCVP